MLQTKASWEIEKSVEKSSLLLDLKSANFSRGSNKKLRNGTCVFTTEIKDTTGLQFRFILITRLKRGRKKVVRWKYLKDANGLLGFLSSLTNQCHLNFAEFFFFFFCGEYIVLHIVRCFYLICTYQRKLLLFKEISRSRLRNIKISSFCCWTWACILSFSFFF